MDSSIILDLKNQQKNYLQNCFFFCWWLFCLSFCIVNFCLGFFIFVISHFIVSLYITFGIFNHSHWFYSNTIITINFLSLRMVLSMRNFSPEMKINIKVIMSLRQNKRHSVRSIYRGHILVHALIFQYQTWPHLVPISFCNLTLVFI